MTTKKVYSDWFKWHGGECPVMRDQEVMVKLHSGVVRGPSRAVIFFWHHDRGNTDIMEYCTATEQFDLEAAEQLLLANGYKITPPTRPLTFEDVTPMTEAPPDGTEYWLVQPFIKDGVDRFCWVGGDFDQATLRHRVAYLEKEHALIAARHIFGLKGGEL